MVLNFKGTLGTLLPSEIAKVWPWDLSEEVGDRVELHLLELVKDALGQDLVLEHGFGFLRTNVGHITVEALVDLVVAASDHLAADHVSNGALHAWLTFATVREVRVVARVRHHETEVAHQLFEHLLRRGVFSSTEPRHPLQALFVYLQFGQILVDGLEDL